jgi:hypothetical protein
MERFLQALEKPFVWLSSLKKGHSGQNHMVSKAEAIGYVLSGGSCGDPCVISSKMLARHLYVLGATGAGKTNLILKLFEQDLARGHTVVIVDLRGDLVERALAICASKSVDPANIRLLDLRERDWILGFSPLAGSGEPFIRALHLLDVLRGESASWGVQLEETLRNALLLLASSNQSLLSLERVLLDSDFAKSLLGSTDDPSVIAFFDRYTAFSKDKQMSWALPIFNKITPLLATPSLRAVLGTTNSLDLDRFLGSKGNVLLVSLAVDELARSGKMLGSLIVSAISRSMFARVNVPEPQRNPVRLYVDEFEAMATESFEGLIAEGRRFKLSLVLSHQNLAQLPTKLRSVIRNNVGLQALFACGFQDAGELVRELQGDAEIDELLELHPGEMFLIPRGGDMLHVQTLLSESTVSAKELRAFRQNIIERHGIPYAAMKVAPSANPQNPQVQHIHKPWGVGGTQ